MPFHYRIRLIAGTFVLIAVALSTWVSPYWNLLAAFVGVNLIQSAFTRWCPMQVILRKLGLAGPDSDGVLGAC